MEKLRQKFWDSSKELIEWCTDKELIVLKSRIDRELNRRIGNQEKKIFGDNHGMSKRKHLHRN